MAEKGLLILKVRNGDAYDDALQAFFYHDGDRIFSLGDKLAKMGKLPGAAKLYELCLGVGFSPGDIIISDDSNLGDEHSANHFDVVRFEGK